MLQRYWPDLQNIDTCIKNEAETADVSVLLAVHQPSPLTRRDVGSNIETPTTEAELLKAFLSDNVPGGYLLLPITGASGVGKSHIVRWLEAQLERHPKRKKLHIIRIPKSASLRTVVELILEPLEGDERYARAREELTRAVGGISIDDAAVLFRAQLENALRARAEQLIHEVRKRPDAKDLRLALGHARALPVLFSDAAVRDHFTKNVLARIITRALEGKDEESDALPQFEESDLILPETLNLEEAAQQVRAYYETTLNSSDPTVRIHAVKLLNEVVDAAIRGVFKLEQSIGGVTLEDIVLSIRELLFDEGKELVLLVEDFAALSGIQEVLLKVCVHEAVRNGEQVRATMRTALALTDGYLAHRDTIHSRAQFEWVIGSRQHDEREIRDRVVEMAGAYLNAARWGEQELRRLFAPRMTEVSGSLTDWIIPWSDGDQTPEAAEALKAFGSTKRGEPLFPFNREAIERLTTRHLSEGGRLVFNPRRVINRVLRDVLLMKPHYERGDFPPADFQDAKANAFLAGWLQRAHRPEPVRKRLVSLFAYWGDQPTSEAAIGRVPPDIFRAFGLPTPQELGDIKYAPPPVPTSAVAPGTRSETSPSGGHEPAPLPPPTPEPAAEDPIIAEWRGKLDAWAAGTQLPQKDATYIRNALKGLLNRSINWAALRLRPQDIQASWIFIPNARGNPLAGRQIALCETHSDETGSVRRALVGLVRANEHGFDWSYDGADDDYVEVANLVDHLLGQLEPLLVREAVQQAGALARALVSQARIAGMAPPQRLGEADDLLAALFDPAPAQERTGFDDQWDELRAPLVNPSALQSARTIMQKHLLERVACFQGTGSKPYAVDVVRLRAAMALEAEDGVPLPDEVRPHVLALGDSKLWTRVQPILARLRSFKDEFRTYFGESFDKAQFVADLQAILPLLQSTGTWPRHLQINYADFHARLADFQQSPVMELVRQAEAITDEAEKPKIAKLLGTLGSMQLPLFGRALSFANDARALLAAAQTAVTAELPIREAVSPGRYIEQITEDLSFLAPEEEAGRDTAMETVS